jgi:hypothetical protein
MAKGNGIKQAQHGQLVASLKDNFRSAGEAAQVVQHWHLLDSKPEGV